MKVQLFNPAKVQRLWIVAQENVQSRESIFQRHQQFLGRHRAAEPLVSLGQVRRNMLISASALHRPRAAVIRLRSTVLGLGIHENVLCNLWRNIARPKQIERQRHGRRARWKKYITGFVKRNGHSTCERVILECLNSQLRDIR